MYHKVDDVVDVDVDDDDVDVVDDVVDDDDDDVDVVDDDDNRDMYSTFLTAPSTRTMIM